eukprot:CAMPEP_0119324260 /NCGR_PEP_ID=MMETSP1333-20130426/62727_1 /TAXON_ID=418940 /ORGANISM="Scyphosphaera apsteinii, Strain RCC1455" /LENGTH=208 /DNA_ID=CAMNT_0007331929 /DNA_START=64 /DNA_END=691 /DNA_ORIENTATION=+
MLPTADQASAGTNTRSLPYAAIAPSISSSRFSSWSFFCCVALVLTTKGSERRDVSAFSFSAISVPMIRAFSSSGTTRSPGGQSARAASLSAFAVLRLPILASASADTLVPALAGVVTNRPNLPASPQPRTPSFGAELDSQQELAVLSYVLHSLCSRCAVFARQPNSYSPRPAAYAAPGCFVATPSARADDFSARFQRVASHHECHQLD